MKKILFLILFLLYGYGVGSETVETETRIIVPAYFYDAAFWEKLIQSKARGSIVIINPSNGPGDVTDINYKTWISQLVGGSKIPVGYVYSSYSNRNITDVYNDIEKWIRLYPQIKGFFIDEVNVSAEAYVYYENLFKFIKMKGDYFIVLNPGTRPNDEMFNVADIVIVFEGDVKNLNTDVCALNPEKSSVIVYNASEDDMKHLGLLNCAYKYFTDDGGSNPYDSLPSYFNEEIEYLK